MTLDVSHELPVCKVSHHDPSRTQWNRRMKDLGMKVAGRLATVLRHLPTPRAANQFGILNYHRIAPVVRGLAPPTLNVPPQLLREQITGLARQGFTFLSLDEVLRRSTNDATLPSRTVVITFDDGFESVYEYAWPTLRELGVPATIFLNTGYLGNQTPFPFDSWANTYANDIPPVTYRPLTVAQCQEMAATGQIALGAHTHTHADFRGRHEMFQRDMQICLDSLKRNFGDTSPTFAFPFGKPSTGFTEKALIDIVRSFGLECALTTEPRCASLADSPYHWGRFNVYEWDTAESLAAKALGFYGWVPRLFERLAPFGRRKYRTLVKARQLSDRSRDAPTHAVPSRGGPS